MPCSPSDFNDLLADLKSNTDITANEVLLIIFLESPIEGWVISRSSINIDALCHEVEERQPDSDQFDSGLLACATVFNGHLRSVVDW